MARKRFGLQFTGWTETIAKLDEIGGSKAMKRGTESALKESKAYVNSQLNTAISKLPAGGRYSTGRTKHSIDKDMTVDWDGLKASTKVGFNFKDSGMTSIFLMYGTPKMSPVNGLKDAIYGAKTKRQVAKIQSEAIQKVIKRIMEAK